MNKRGLGVTAIVLIIAVFVIALGIVSGNFILFDLGLSPKFGDIGAIKSECNDKKDNDGDGLIDFGGNDIRNDPDCSSSSDKTENFYEICTARDLDRVREDLSGSYVQKCDIDLEEYDFEPIATSDEPFAGSYDGQNKKISNYILQDGGRDAVGIFSGLADATIKNLNLIDFNITARKFVGALAGGIVVKNTIVDNVYSSGFINGDSFVGGLIGTVSGNNHGGGTNQIINSHSSVNINGFRALGGLIGNSHNEFVPDGAITIIKNSSASGNIVGNHQIGGFIGMADDNFLIDLSYASGDLIGNDYGVGGFIGSLGPGTIKRSYSLGKVSGFVNVGGFAGQVDGGSITDCYAKGNVNAIDASGGFIGWVWEGNLNNSYSIGFVNRSGRSGGLIGVNIVGNVVSSYWDFETSGHLHSDGGEGRTTGEMTSVPRPSNTYVNWDFVDVWEQIDGEYPWLQMEEAD